MENQLPESERGKFNSVAKKLREAEVTPDEYPLLVAAYSHKYDRLQPAVTTVVDPLTALLEAVKALRLATGRTSGYKGSEVDGDAHSSWRPSMYLS